MPQNITFRTTLLGGVSEFCHGSNLQILANALHLVELIVQLARYKEEGVSLCPKVYLTNDIHTINAMLPEGESLKIGCVTSDVNGLQQVLKKCAPLANSGWLIYIEDNGDVIEYGLFKGSSNPIAVLVDDVVMTENDELAVVKVFQIAEDCVEIQANNGTLHYIFLNHRKDDTPPPLQFLDKLVYAITEKTLQEDKEPTISFLNRTLFESLRQSHGCIIAVTNMNKAPKFLSKDSVMLEQPIDFVTLVGDLKKGKISPSMLENKGHLLRGMLNSDGVIVFNSKGCLLGYNCFVKIKEKTKEKVVGGARKRAFSSVASKIGHGICAVFMQSQDGWTDFIGSDNE